MVLPMIPKELSNGICSLNPKVDRLTLSVLAEIDKNGEVIDYKICESVINSNERMTYTDVYAVLQGDEATTKKYEHMKESFFLMAELNEILENKRKKRRKQSKKEGRRSSRHGSAITNSWRYS